MEYRLIRNTSTGQVLVVGSDGFASQPLREADYLTADAELRADWWRVPRDEYNTALWDHPLWRLEARHDTLALAAEAGHATYADFLTTLRRLATVSSQLHGAHREEAYARYKRLESVLGAGVEPGVGASLPPALSEASRDGVGANAG
ncbi:MAG TPA: hypothetical protein VFL91_05525 [Thermomicrobiales bacterium]|nr:hypothetical protein [Thermomicrobiales bacterium]